MCPTISASKMSKQWGENTFPLRFKSFENKNVPCPHDKFISFVGYSTVDVPKWLKGSGLSSSIEVYVQGSGKRSMTHSDHG